MAKNRISWPENCPGTRPGATALVDEPYAICFTEQPAGAERWHDVDDYEGWEGAFAKAVAEYFKDATAARIRAIESDVNELAQQVRKLTDGNCLIVPVTTFAPEPFDVIGEIRVLVERTGSGYLATLFDANIGMVGHTDIEAVDNLKQLVADVYDQLEQAEKNNELGPWPTKQLAVLRSLIKKQP
jgi:hypothetical protein